jgi:hypothetical protein
MNPHFHAYANPSPRVAKVVTAHAHILPMQGLSVKGQKSVCSIRVPFKAAPPTSVAGGSWGLVLG